MLEMLDFLNKICNNNLSSVSAVSQNSSLLAFESCVYVFGKSLVRKLRQQFSLMHWTFLFFVTRISIEHMF